MRKLFPNFARTCFSSVNLKMDLCINEFLHPHRGAPSNVNFRWQKLNHNDVNVNLEY